MLILSITTCALYLILIGSLLFGIYQVKSFKKKKKYIYIYIYN